MANFGWPNVPEYVWNANSIAYHEYHGNRQFLDMINRYTGEPVKTVTINNSGSGYTVDPNYIANFMMSQPMTGPSSEVFALRAKYKDQYMAANNVAQAAKIDQDLGIIETTNAALEAAKAAGIQQEKDKGMDFAKQIIAWRKAGHSMYAEDVLNMMIEHNIITLSEARRLIQENKEKPQEAKLPKTYLDNGN